jgi:uncharacterized protein DUF3800
MIEEWAAGQLARAKKPHPVDYKIYCDESCHLEHDGCDVMVFGALRADAAAVEPAVRAIKELRSKYKYEIELKWTKLLQKQLPFYLELLDLFLANPCLRFKATVVINKHLLDHTQYNDGSHGVFYYKMAYYTLRDFLERDKSIRVHLDYMDTQGNSRAQKLLEVLGNARSAGVLSAQIIRSHESQLIQLCDILIGAMAYARRFPPEKRSKVKGSIVAHLEKHLGRALLVGTPPWEEKFNIFVFSPRGSQ